MPLEGQKESESVPINAAWHKAHPMPARATLDQRLKWHVAHAAACACRPMPQSIVAELDRRKALATPRRATKD